jgi:hypothetical protein
MRHEKTFFPSKTKLRYARRLFGQYILMSGTHLRPKTRLLLQSESCRVPCGVSFLRRGCIGSLQLLLGLSNEIILVSESRTIFYSLKIDLPLDGEPGPRTYWHTWQSGSVIFPATVKVKTLCYDGRSVGQSVWASDTTWGAMTEIFSSVQLCSDSWGFIHMGRRLWLAVESVGTVEFEVKLRSTVSQPVYLGVEPFFGAHNKIFLCIILIWKFLESKVAPPPRDDRRFCNLLCSVLSNSLRFHNHTLLSHWILAVTPRENGFPFCRLL